MKKFLFGILIALSASLVFAGQNLCLSIVPGYRVVKNSVYDFLIGKERACFFAFYTENPYPYLESSGHGNVGDAIWYAYYIQKNPDNINEFPKAFGGEWSNVCTIDAVSFISIYGDKNRDVTVIGSCDKNKKHITYSFVFMRRGDRYMIDMQLYNELYEIIDLTIADLQKYIKFPQFLSELKKRV